MRNIGAALRGRLGAGGVSLALLLLAMAPYEAQALPAFARQTGQNCVACHAGGQFPELTPYGRMFKLTGYTIGTRVVPLSVMGVAGYAKVADTSKSDNPASDFYKNGVPLLASGSVFIAGKLTDNIGAFSQITYDNYANLATDNQYAGHTQADNMDFRYADRFIDGNRDIVFGVSLNNNPSVSDPWNTAAAWMQYVPTPSPASHQFIDGKSPFPGFGSGGNLAGLSAYLFWNQTLYAELGSYRTSKGALSFMSAGLNGASTTQLNGSNNPYWRLALSHEWGPHNLMVGTSGMIAHVYDANSDITDPNDLGRFKNVGVDAQYQYILDPHTVTVQMAYTRQTQDYSANTIANGPVDANGNPLVFVDANGNPLAPVNPSDTTNIFRAKLSYVYQARYGGSVALFNRTGTSNTLNQNSGYDPVFGVTSDPTGALGATALSTRVTGNFSGNPGTRGYTYEAFWMPVQYVRAGVQYTAYSKYNGASDNYDGFGRNARDNNTLFLYVWGAY
ncbi:MAG: hypothetical protein PHU46_15630 [Rhodocyclaceae bacterium]|nr:hypothetical protein [Rhodocyclaceae bacterium]